MNIAVYDLEISPLTFDCIKFFLLAQQHFTKQGAAEPFALIIVLPTPNRLEKLNERYQKVGLEHGFETFIKVRISKVLFECAKLVPLIDKVFSVENRAELFEKIKNASDIYPSRESIFNGKPSYGLDLVMREVAHGHTLPSIKAPKQSICDIIDVLEKKNLNNKRIITITLRQCAYQIERNSNLDIWFKFAQWLNGKGYSIVWIPDVEASMPFIPDIGFVLESVIDNVLYKAALYQFSSANYFVNSGNAALARFNHNATSISTQLDATPERFWLGKGVLPGEQFTFLSPHHYQIWADETFENLKYSFEHFTLPKLSLTDEERVEQVVDWEKAISINKRKKSVKVLHTIESGSEVYVWCPAAHRANVREKLARMNVGIAAYIESFDFGGSLDGLSVIHPYSVQSSDKPILIAGYSNQSKPIFDMIKHQISQYYSLLWLLIDGNKVLNLEHMEN